MTPAPPVFVITGQLAAGKSTVARALLDRFPFGLHVDVDGVREMVTSGLASPLEWTDETTRQFELAVAASVAMAAVYHAAGFAVAIEGAVDPDSIERHAAAAGLSAHVVGVVLHPRVDVALDRNRERTNKPFDTTVLDAAVRRLDADLAAQPPPSGWVVLDNSDETVGETAERILSSGGPYSVAP